MTFEKLGRREAENREWGKFSKAAPFQESESGEREGVRVNESNFWKQWTFIKNKDKDFGEKHKWKKEELNNNYRERRKGCNDFDVWNLMDWHQRQI